MLKENQERLKKEPTEAEKIVWERLRNHQLGTKFRRQHIIDNYIADFVSLEKKLIIEVDGEYHGTPKQKNKDKERTLHLESLGYHLLRFTNNEIIAQPDRVIERIKACIAQPPLYGGGAGGEALLVRPRGPHPLRCMRRRPLSALPGHYTCLYRYCETSHCRYPRPGADVRR